jgi:hypothetical protein
MPPCSSSCPLAIEPSLLTLNDPGLARLNAQRYPEPRPVSEPQMHAAVSGASAVNIITRETPRAQSKNRKPPPLAAVRHPASALSDGRCHERHLLGSDARCSRPLAVSRRKLSRRHRRPPAAYGMHTSASEEGADPSCHQRSPLGPAQLMPNALTGTHGQE